MTRPRAEHKAIGEGRQPLWVAGRGLGLWTSLMVEGSCRGQVPGGLASGAESYMREVGWLRVAPEHGGAPLPSSL